MVTLSIIVIVLIVRAMVRKSRKVVVSASPSAAVRKTDRDSAKEIKSAEIERKKQFEIEQAEFDASFFERRLDALFAEYWEIKDQIAEAEENVKGYEQARHYERASKERKEIAKLQKKLSSLDSTIHNTEKKLRAAQYKAGKQVLC